jgi:sulfatase modifying factor 1
MKKVILFLFVLFISFCFTGCRAPVPEINLKSVPSGSYYVGENPPKDNNVAITRNYRIAETEVTYELWYRVKTWAMSNGYTFAHPGKEGLDGIKGAPPQTDKNEPVTYISWRDAIVWCNALSEMSSLIPVYTYSGLAIRNSQESNATSCDNAVFNYNATGYRLPTEAEWEIAARGAGLNGTYGTTYAGSDTINKVAWYKINSGSATHAVGTKAANEIGTFDMSGNVGEWCWDWYGDVGAEYPQTVIDPTGPSTGGPYRVMRGGSCYTDPDLCTVSCRYYGYPYSESSCLGFRLVKNQ